MKQFLVIFVPALAVVAVGVTAAMHGEADDAPGLALLGIILIVCALAAAGQNRPAEQLAPAAQLAPDCLVGDEVGWPRDPVADHRAGRRTVGRDRLRGLTSPDISQRALGQPRRAGAGANRAGVRRGGGLRGEVARGGQGEVHQERLP